MSNCYYQIQNRDLAFKHYSDYSGQVEIIRGGLVTHRATADFGQLIRLAASEEEFPTVMDDDGDSMFTIDRASVREFLGDACRKVLMERLELLDAEQVYLENQDRINWEHRSEHLSLLIT